MIFYWSEVVCHCAFFSQELPSLVDLTTFILGSYIPAAIRDKDFYKPQPQLIVVFILPTCNVMEPFMWEPKSKKNRNVFSLTAGEVYADGETEEDLPITAQSPVN